MQKRNGHKKAQDTQKEAKTEHSSEDNRLSNAAECL
jgi:hypothetical protein